MSELVVPTIRVLEAITPANSATGNPKLIYLNLGSAVVDYGLTHNARDDRVWEAAPDSIEEESSARQLAFEYLLRTSQKVNEADPGRRDVWADRFTQASIEAYGQPDPIEVTRLISNKYTSLLRLRGDDKVSQTHLNYLIETYRPIYRSNAVDTAARDFEYQQQKLAIHEYGRSIIEKYQPLFDLVDDAGLSQYRPADLVIIGNQAFDWLAEHDDSDWSEYHAELFDRANVSHSAKTRELLIGERLVPRTPEGAKALIAHEILVHLMQVKNGYKTDDPKLPFGYPGGMDISEGLATLTSEAVTGSASAATPDFYIDIALALGTVDGIQRTRAELFDIAFAERLIRAQLESQLDERTQASLVAHTWSHVDRIYRGGPGDNAAGRQAIFTKDIAYYVGYVKMSKYIRQQVEAGKSAAEVFEYLSLGVFDPTNPPHTKRLAKAIRR